MSILDARINHSLGNGYIKVYADDHDKFVVQVVPDNQKSQYAKVFPLKETALLHARWVQDNWAYHIKSTSLVKLTPLTYK